MTNFFFTQNLFVTKILPWSKFSWRKVFLTHNHLGPKHFWTQNFYLPVTFLDAKFCGAKIIQSQNLFGANICFNSTFFKTNNFQDENLFVQQNILDIKPYCFVMLLLKLLLFAHGENPSDNFVKKLNS